SPLDPAAASESSNSTSESPPHAPNITSAAKIAALPKPSRRSIAYLRVAVTRAGRVSLATARLQRRSSRLMLASVMSDAIDELARLLAAAERIVVFTGAGIS